MRRRLAILLVLVLAVAAVVLWRLVPERGGDGPLTLYGNVDIREVDLAFRVAGRLQSMRAEEGDRVQAGDLLARLDETPYRESLDAAEARVRVAAAQLQLRRSGSRPEEIERAEASVREARAALRNAEQELQRQRELADRGVTSQSSLDLAETRYEETAARLRAAEEALALARAGFRAEEVESAEGELALARAEAARAETALQDARLHAPADGTIITRIREPGAVVAAGEPVYTLSLDAPVWIRAYIDEPDLGRMAPGMRAWIETDSSARRYAGQVGFISPRAEFTPKNVQSPRVRTDLVYRLRIVVTDPDDGLRQGMPVTVTFEDRPSETGQADG